MEKLLKNITKDRQHNSDTDRNQFENESSPSTSVDNDSDIMHTESPNCDNNASDDSIHQQLEKLTITDYERTCYIGASSGIHFLEDEIMRSCTKRRISTDPTWFVQKLNDENEEHVFMKSKEFMPSDTTININAINRAEAFEDVPFMTLNFLDHLIHM